MSEAAHHHSWASDEFYTWLATQTGGRYELVDGEIVAMAGANRRHDRIAANALRFFGNALEGHPCQPFTADTYIAIPAGNRRQADMGVDCGTPDDADLEAAEPTMVLEILSPTTRAFDRQDKLEEYKTVAALEYIILVDPDYPQVRVYQRGPSGSWESERLTGLETLIKLPRFDVELPLSTLYGGLVFRPQPTLVSPQDTEGKLAI